jgi:hypothetical protein
MTSDVTGFELDPTILCIGLAVSVVIQLMKDNTEIEVEMKSGEKKKISFKSDRQNRKL